MFFPPQSIPNDSSFLATMSDDWCISRRVSSSSARRCDDDDEQRMPAIEPVSHSTSEKSAATSYSSRRSLLLSLSSDDPINIICITGEFSDVEDRYRIEPHILGEGHHGSVRECVDRLTGIRYAVKSVRKGDPAVKPGGLAREILLLREMKKGASCENIIELVDVFEDFEYVHLVTRLCEGGELFDRIVEKSTDNRGTEVPCFAEDDAARILSQILAAVSHMHRRGVVHRDIKPENVLFESSSKLESESSSSVRIVDFGLSRKHRPDLGEPPMSTVVGTPYYIAPEVLRGRYDRACDIWSVGVVAYTMLCGYPPFNGATDEEVRRSVLRGRLRFPVEEWGGVSDEAVDFVRRMLRSDPAKRMTADEALNHPWLVDYELKNNAAMRMEEEEHQDHSSVEVVYCEPQKRTLVQSCGYSAAMTMRTNQMRCPTRSPPRKVRKSMFGL